jgi:hypothetical protein
MTLVKDFFNHKAEKPGNIGMELEVESTQNIPPFVNNIWLAKADHSLRNVGTEFYTRNPINYDQHFMGRVTSLVDFLKDKTFGVDYNSTRTSFHVHINVTNHTMLQMWTQVFAYWLLEQPLMELCGKSRCGNQFCLRCKDAEAQVQMVGNLLTTPNYGPRSFESDNLRYASQNLKALVQFGSLEYRGMRGTHDPEVLHDWAHGMWYLSQAIKQFKHPAELFTYFDINIRADFVRAILPPKLANQVLAQPDYQATTSEGFDILFDMVYDTDWDGLEASYAKYLKDKPPAMEITGLGWAGTAEAQFIEVEPAPRPVRPRPPPVRRNILGG